MPLTPTLRARRRAAVACAVMLAGCGGDETTATRTPAPDGASPALAWAVDGQLASASRAASLAGERIARLEIGDAARVALTSVAGAADGARAAADTTGRFAGVVLVDGAPASEATVAALAPEQVAHVTILQGDAARARSDRPEAAAGVIVITTRAAGRTE